MTFPIGFKGRASRMQVWMVALAQFVLTTGALFTMPALLYIIIPVMAVVGISVTVQRYHDRDKSGWWIWISAVPFIGALWQFIELGFLPGTPGDNHYGPPPGRRDPAKSGGPSGQDAGTASIDMSNIDAAIERMKAQAMANAQQAKASPMPAAAMPAAPMPTAPMPGRPSGAMGRPAFGQRTTFGQRG